MKNLFKGYIRSTQSCSITNFLCSALNTYKYNLNELYNKLWYYHNSIKIDDAVLFIIILVVCAKSVHDLLLFSQNV